MNMKLSATSQVPTSKVTDSSIITMESLALPEELYWNGKMEPTSPPTKELFSTAESTACWLYDDNFANGITITSDDVLDLKPGLELIDCEDFVVELYDLKEEWGDSKLLSSTFEYPVGTIIPHPNPITRVNSKYEIGVLDANEIDTAILTPLTPPQSPPQNSAAPASPLHIITAPTTSHNLTNVPHQTPNASPSVPPTLTSSQSLSQPQSQPQSPAAAPLTAASVVQNLNFTNCFNNQGVHALSDDTARDAQLVDEILKLRANEFVWNDDGSESQSSSGSSSMRAESITDEDWLPEASVSSSASSSPTHSDDVEMCSATTSAGSATSTASATKKRTRPYGRGIEDRKIRKKEQNKNAATRYRQKKKLEMENVLSEEQLLQQHHENLKRELAERKREAKYLRTLIRELYANRLATD